MTTVKQLFAHVVGMSDGRGIFEHAAGSAPRVEGGYCLDDTARALIATASRSEIQTGSLTS